MSVRDLGVGREPARLSKYACTSPTTKSRPCVVFASWWMIGVTGQTLYRCRVIFGMAFTDPSFLLRELRFRPVGEFAELVQSALVGERPPHPLEVS